MSAEPLPSGRAYYVCAGIIVAISLGLLALGAWGSALVGMMAAGWICAHPYFRHEWYRIGFGHGFTDGHNMARHVVPPGLVDAVNLLGEQVIVVLSGSADEEQAVTRGQLLAIGDSGEFVIMDDCGFCHYAWPMLDIKRDETVR